jgi:hypothetical protein
MTFCVYLSLLFLVRGALDNRTRDFAVAGVLAGAAASIKYNAVLMVAALIAALVTPAFARSHTRASAWQAAAESAHIAVPHSYDLGYGGVYHIVFSLRYGLGLPLLVAGLAGFVWLARADWRKAALLGVFPVAFRHRSKESPTGW